MTSRPAVRALAWGDRALFGVDRVTKADDWRLRAELPARTADAAFDPAATWTLFAGGDILLDRGVYQTVAHPGQGRRLPVRWRHGRDHLTLQGLLADRLGPAPDPPDRQRRRRPRRSSPAPTSRSRTSRTRRPNRFR